MQSPLSYEIRSRVIDVVRGKMNITDFESWFVPATWSVDRDADAETARVVHEIMASLIGMQDGEVTESQFMELLRRHATTAHLVMGSSSTTVQTSSTVTVIHPPTLLDMADTQVSVTYV